MEHPLVPLPYDLFRSWAHKAVRRGETPFTLAHGLPHLPEFRQRLVGGIGTIALEDVGIADLEAVAFAFDLPRRLNRQPDAVRAGLILETLTRLAMAPKSRDACDLINLVHAARGMTRARLHALGDLPPETLIAIATEPAADLDQRTAAMAYLIGTNQWRQNSLPRRDPDPKARDMALDLLGLSETERAMVIKGGAYAHLLSAGLAIATALRRADPGPHKLIETQPPPSPLIGGVPAHAYDQYTAQGRDALTLWVETDRALISATPDLRPSQRLRAIKFLVFVTESGLLSRRLLISRSPEIEQGAFLREAAAAHVAPDRAQALADLVQARLPELDLSRARIVAGSMTARAMGTRPEGDSIFSLTC